MDDKYIIALLSLTNLGLIWYYIFDKITDKEPISKDNPNEIEEPVESESIVGKSKFKMPKSVPSAANSTPLDATAEKGEDIVNMPATFASQTEEKPSTKVAEEDMDSTFKDVRMESTPTSYSDDDDDYDGVPNDKFAKGSTFEEIGESMKIANNQESTPEQRRKAGRVFSELEGTTLFEKIVHEFPERKWAIFDMIDKIYHEANSKEAAPARERFKPLSTLDEFNIRDYV